MKGFKNEHMITNEKKEQVCIIYDEYLRIIDKLGHGIMLQKQFIDICIKLNVSKDRFEVIKAIKDLQAYQIIKKINFKNTKNKFIIFKKFAIRYLSGAKLACQVAGLRPPSTNRKFYDSIFKMKFILDVIIPYIESRKKPVNLNELVITLNRLCCNILESKNSQVDYYKYKLYKFEDIIYTEEYEKHIKLLEKEKMLRKDNLNGKIRVTKKSRKKRQDYIDNSTINTLVNKDIYIAQIIKKDKRIVVTVYFFDLQNSQNTANISFNIAITYNIFKKLFCESGFDIHLNFRIATFDEIAERNIKNGLTKIVDIPKLTVYDSGDINNNTTVKGQYWLKWLSYLYNPNYKDKDNIDIKYINFKIEDNISK